MEHGTGPAMRIEREFVARPAELFRAWLDAERCAHWFQPLGPIPASSIAIEPTVGGRWCAEFAAADRPPTRVIGTIRELRVDEHLVIDLDATLLPQNTSLHLDLTPTPKGTRVTLVHEGLTEDQIAAIGGAWTHCLDRILGACPLALDAFYAGLDRGPVFHSPFGGLWPDLSNADALLAGKRSLGRLDDDDVERFRHWMGKGYLTLPGAVDPALCDRLRAEVESNWSRGNNDIAIECFDGRASFRTMQPQFRDLPHKVLDYHAASALARDAIFAPAVRRFLELLFERPPTAFQSLLFRWGTEQAMHQDTAYVLLRSPMEFVGYWLALEDVQEGSGELQYFAGSHRNPEFLWFDRSRAMPYGYGDDDEFLRWVDEKSRASGCEVVRFLPKKGDVLLWHADLAHGGSKRTRRELTRWSLVTHFCPLDVDPLYSLTRPGPAPREHVPGCWYRAPGK